jgi:CubicO group peptidase (beta-lactamase class C family)
VTASLTTHSTWIDEGQRDYGYLWWLNRQGKNYPGLPATAYGARGAGGNTITIVPDRELLVVLRWQQGNEAEFVQKVIASIR